MRKIKTNGITSIESLPGSSEWYWGTDYVHGDLYEAEELYQSHHSVKCNRLVFVHYPDGRVAEPIQGKAGQYFGCPVLYEGKIQILLVDFPKSTIGIYQYDDSTGQVTETVSLPLAAVEDCYNLLLHRVPLMLTRQANDGKFQIIWPDNVEFDITDTEVFVGRSGERLYFSRWYEDPNYREEVVVRKYPTGEITEVFAGSCTVMPDGQIWILQ